MTLLFVLLLSLPAHALDVVCTLPYLGAITEQLAPDAEVVVLSRGTEDPHHISPTPALMAKVRKADAYVVNGLSLELWSSRLLDSAGNPRIRPGQPGYILGSQGVPRLEVPTQISRAGGDLHPEGSPHIWLDPLNWTLVADNIAAGLSRVDPEHADAYRAHAKDFRDEVYRRTFGADLVGFMGGALLDRLARSGKLHDFLAAKQLDTRLGGWLAAAAPIRGRPVVFYHQSWAYFIDRFSPQVIGMIEDRPGIAPSAAHRDQLRRSMSEAGVGVVGVTSYYDDRLARVLAEETGYRLSTLPGDVGGTPAASGLFAMMDTLVAELGR